jgi:uncharacterized membrane protein HdeD (DUF308 family)
MTPLLAFLYGLVAMGFAVSALFFVRYWLQTRDRLFLFFAAAFGLMAIERVAVVLAQQNMENVSWFYLFRLVAFVIIVWAIVDRNRRTG